MSRRTHVDWSSGAVELLVEGREWTRADGPRRAGVSSFGVSGTNAHVILEEAPRGQEQADERGPDPGVVGGLVPWVLSGKSAKAVERQAGKLRDFVAADAGLDLADIGLVVGVEPVAVRAPCGGAGARPGRTAERPGVVERRRGVRRGGPRRSPGTSVASPSCSPGRARSGSVWAGSCTTPSRSSRRASTRARPHWPSGSTGRCSTWCAAWRVRRPWTGWTWCSRRCSR